MEKLENLAPGNAKPATLPFDINYYIQYMNHQYNSQLEDLEEEIIKKRAILDLEKESYYGYLSEFTDRFIDDLIKFELNISSKNVSVIEVYVDNYSDVIIEGATKDFCYLLRRKGYISDYQLDHQRFIDGYGDESITCHVKITTLIGNLSKL